MDLSSSTRSDPLYGALFETYVAQNLLSIISTRWQQATMHFWAMQGRHEVDFVIESGQSCIAIELKSSARWQEKDLSGLKAFFTATPHCGAAVLCCNGKDPVELDVLEAWTASLKAHLMATPKNRPQSHHYTPAQFGLAAE